MRRTASIHSGGVKWAWTSTTFASLLFLSIKRPSFPVAYRMEARSPLGSSGDCILEQALLINVVTCCRIWNCWRNSVSHCLSLLSDREFTSACYVLANASRCRLSTMRRKIRAANYQRPWGMSIVSSHVTPNLNCPGITFTCLLTTTIILKYGFGTPWVPYA